MQSAPLLNSCMLCCRLFTDSGGDDLCSGGTDIHFTNYTWPTGVKIDRGLNITFTKDIILPPGGFAGGKGSNGQANVLLSFKDDTNHFRQALELYLLKSARAAHANASCNCYLPCLQECKSSSLRTVT